MQITITIPKPMSMLRWGLLVAAVVIAAVVVLPTDSPNSISAIHAMPCPDIDGDQVVTETDLDKLKSWFGKLVPPAPAAVDLDGDGGVTLNDSTIVVFALGTFTKCQDTPAGFQGGGPQINITKYGKYLLPKTCHDVLDASQVFLFTVCDNDFQGPPALSPLCSGGVCDDEDPNEGLTRVSLVAPPALLHVVESKPAEQHTGDTSKLTCATSGKCGLIFHNSPNTNPWFPWDLPTGIPPAKDGGVVANDISAVVAHFGEIKP